jgi:hypothetical protein
MCSFSGCDVVTESLLSDIDSQAQSSTIDIEF